MPSHIRLNPRSDTNFNTMEPEQLEEIQFTCCECQKQFDPDPDCVLLEQVDAQFVPEDGSDPEPLDAFELTQDEREDAKKQLGINDEQLNQILMGEAATVGGITICKECQDRMESE